MLDAEAARIPQPVARRHPRCSPHPASCEYSRWPPGNGTLIEIFDLRRQLAPHADALEAKVIEVMRRGRYILGEEVIGFEREFADYCGVPHALGVANCTDALELALRTLHVGAGDRVVTVANAGGYTSTATLAIGAEPLYVDIDPRTLQFDLGRVRAALSTAPRALVLTHLYGRLGRVPEAVEAARAAGVPVIEDCGQAHGARIGGTCAGGFGDIGCFSFYPTKNLGALGDGGALTLRDPVLAERAKRLRQYGWQGKYTTVDLGGRNSRLDEIQAAALRVRLPHLDAENAARRRIARRYLDGIRNAAITLPSRGDLDDIFHLFVVRCAQRTTLRAALSQAGIASDVHFPIPDHRQPALAARYPGLSLPETERAADEVLSLPCHPFLTDAETALVIDCCNRFRG